MKNLKIYLNEGLRLGIDDHPETLQPKTRKELIQIILDRFEEEGPGTKQDPIYFNDIDVSNINDFYELFCNMPFRYIDLSDWDVSNVWNMHSMFDRCIDLREVNLSGWDVRKLESAGYMFDRCKLLEKVYLSWKNTSKIALFKRMFCECVNLKEIDMRDFDLSGAKDMWRMFSGCISLKRLYLPNDFVPTKGITVTNMFTECKKEIIPNWYNTYYDDFI